MKNGLKGSLKKALLIYGGFIIILAVTCIIVYISYSNKVRKTAKESLLAAQKLTELVPNLEDYESTSTDLSKSINEVLKNEDLVENDSVIEEKIIQCIFSYRIIFP